MSPFNSVVSLFIVCVPGVSADFELGALFSTNFRGSKSALFAMNQDAFGVMCGLDLEEALSFLPCDIVVSHDASVS